MSLQAIFPELGATVPLAAGGTLATDGDFEVLALALDAAGLTDTVAGLTDFTLFAPSDAAFAELATATGFVGDTTDAAAVFESIASTLASLDPQGDPIPLLTNILLYHVSPQETALTDLNGAGEVDTLFNGTGFQVTGGTIVDADPDAPNAEIVSNDIETQNGTIQVVDQVLLPIDTPVDTADPTLLNLLEESGGSPDEDGTDFDLLLTALQATGLDAVVDGPEADLTVFLPTDDAFVSLAQSLGYEGEDEGEALVSILEASAAADPENPLQLVTDILTYHVSPGLQDADAVLSSDSLDTVNGATIGVDGTTLVDQEPDLDDPSIVQTNLEASNGIAHVIDEVLLPIDLPQSTSDDTVMIPTVPDTDDSAVEDTPEPTPAETDDGGGFSELFLALGFAAVIAAMFAGA